MICIDLIVNILLGFSLFFPIILFVLAMIISYVTAAVTINLIIYAVLYASVITLGIVGMCVKMRLLLKIFVILIAVMTIFQFSIGLSLLVKKTLSKRLVDGFLEKTYKKSASGEKHYQTLVHGFQRYYKCCGHKSSQEPEVKVGEQLIDSCCNSTVERCTESEAYSDSCRSKLYVAISHKMGYVGGLCIGFAVIQALLFFIIYFFVI